MKRTIVTFLALLMSLSIASASFAASAEVVKSVNFRSAPSTDSQVIRLLTSGESIEVLKQVNSYWLKVQTSDGKTGYISANSKYTNYSDSESTIVTTAYPYLRSAPTIDSKIYTSVPKGTTLTVLDEPNSYYVKVKYNGQTGYISTKYIEYTSSGSSSNSSSSSLADAIIDTAKSLMYRAEYDYGTRDTKNLIFDCSSFTQYVFDQHGISLKWGTRYQKNAGTYVKKSNLQKGDLVFFSVGSSSEIGHVGIYIGDGDFIHILDKDGSDVHIRNLDSGYWEEHYITARRVI